MIAENTSGKKFKASISVRAQTKKLSRPVKAVQDWYADTQRSLPVIKAYRFMR